MGLLSELVHRLRHALKEERLCLLFAAVSVGCGDKLLNLRHCKRGKKLGEDGLQRATQPYIEEIRKISIANIVVIGRVSGYNLASTFGLDCCVQRNRPSGGGCWKRHADDFCQQVDLSLEVA